MAKRRFRRRRFTTKNLSIAKRALKKVNKLARRVRPEMKVFDVDLTTLSPTVALQVIHVNGIAQGDGIENRDGLQVTSTFLQMRYSFLINGSATSTICRLAVVRDNMQVESKDPIGLDVYLAADVRTQKTRLLPKRFTYLMDRTISMSINQRRTITGKFNKRVNFPMRWVGSTATSQSKNGVYVLVWTDQGTNLPSLSFTFRTWFTDM